MYSRANPPYPERKRGFHPHVCNFVYHFKSKLNVIYIVETFTNQVESL
jgi:hypothetical protein